ncbi:MAG: baseplate J/gp47 family protein [Gammaproteobacteria bacterium]|nr:baseplate J/gp47 family protein [Gammaproteobacteria bacterium]
MPFLRPSLSDLIERAAADIQTQLPGTEPRLRRSLLDVLSRVHSGVSHALYGYINWSSQQFLPDTADAEALDRMASLWLQQPRLAAVAAVGSADLSGIDGSVIPAGTLLQRGDGVEYATTAEVTIAAGVAVVAVAAVVAGADGNAVMGVSLTLVSPIAGVQSQATVAAGGLTGGADVEVDDSLRARIITRMRQQPHGGAKHDYEQWASEAHPDVTRVWVYPQELAANGVTIRLMTDDATANGIPQQAVIDAVQAYIDGVRPTTADPIVVAPIAVPLDITISGLSPDTSEVRAAVEAELADLVRRDAEPGGAVLVSRIREAISIAAGESDHVLVSPVADIAHATGEIAVPGVVTWA